MEPRASCRREGRAAQRQVKPTLRCNFILAGELASWGTRALYQELLLGPRPTSLPSAERSRSLTTPATAAFGRRTALLRSLMQSAISSAHDQTPRRLFSRRNRSDLRSVTDTGYQGWAGFL